MLNSFLRRRAEAMSWARLAVTRRGISPFKTRTSISERRLRSGFFFLSSSPLEAPGWALVGGAAGEAPLEGSFADSGLAPGSAAGGLEESDGTDGTGGTDGFGLGASG